jgi:hypothetical protein
MDTSAPATEAVTTEDFQTPAEFCRTYNLPPSTVSARIRKGDIALHQFFGEPRPKINVSEALRVTSAIRRPYNSPDLRLVRHDEPVAARPVKSDLFA